MRRRWPAAAAPVGPGRVGEPDRVADRGEGRVTEAGRRDRRLDRERGRVEPGHLAGVRILAAELTRPERARRPGEIPDVRPRGTLLDLAGRRIDREHHGRRAAGRLAGLGDAQVQRPVRTHDVPAGPGDVVVDDDDAGRRATGAARSRCRERQVERRRALRLQLVGRLVERDVVVRAGHRDVIGALVGEIGVGHAAARRLRDREGRRGQVRRRLGHRLGREPRDGERRGRLARRVVEQRRRRGHEPAGREHLVQVVVALVAVDRDGDPRPVGGSREAQAGSLGDPRDQPDTGGAQRVRRQHEEVDPPPAQRTAPRASVPSGRSSS